MEATNSKAQADFCYLDNCLIYQMFSPHNFSLRIEANLINFEKLLEYYRLLNQEYDMRLLFMWKLMDLCRKI